MKNLQQHPSRKPPAKRLPTRVEWWLPGSQPSYAPTRAFWRCDRCQSLTGFRVYDPWGGFHGTSCGDCEEAANERSLSEYYGGSGPQTLDEQHRAAHKLK